MPLPVRFGLWGLDDGLCVEVLVREDRPALHQAISEQFHAAGIPLNALQFVTVPAQLKRPLPWRGDLHEHSF